MDSMPYAKNSEAIFRARDVAKNLPPETPRLRLVELEQRYAHDETIIAALPASYRKATLPRVRDLLARNVTGGAA